jgi:hypothetical protein
MRELQFPGREGKELIMPHGEITWSIRITFPDTQNALFGFDHRNSSDGMCHSFSGSGNVGMPVDHHDQSILTLIAAITLVGIVFIRRNSLELVISVRPLSMSSTARSYV